MQVTLETRCTDGSVDKLTVLECADYAEALTWAVRNWSPAQAFMGNPHGLLLNRDLIVDGRPVGDVLAEVKAAEMRRAA